MLEFCSNSNEKILGNIKKIEAFDETEAGIRIYDIKYEKTLNGEPVYIDVECKAWDNLWNTPSQYEGTLRTQFSKDLKKMDFLGQKNWIFKESSLIGDAQAFKNRIKNALMPGGVPCAEIAADFQTYKTKYAALVGITEVNPSFTEVVFLNKLFEDNRFNKIFFRK